LIGVNQRDLTSFEVDHDRALRVVEAIPDDVVAVAESGIRHAEDARRLAQAGYRAILVGETLMRAEDRRKALAGLVGHPLGHGHDGRVGGRPGRVGS
jgi:indole-3-glycerol phosphate synthase